MEYTKKYVQKLEKELKEVTEPGEQNFIILKRIWRTEFEWVEYIAMNAKSPEEAIAKVFEGVNKPSGRYLAIPAAYWVRQVDFDEPIERIA